MNIKIADLEFEPLISYETIQERILEIAQQLNLDYADKSPIFVGVLNGAFMFFGDLLKEVTIPCEVAFTKLSSYHGGLKSSKIINDEYDLRVNIDGRHVILVEDIVDTGHTLNYLIAKLEVRKPASLAVCALLQKPDALAHKIDELKYIALKIENEFVVGYGLDYMEMGRNVRGIYKRVV